MSEPYSAKEGLEHAERAHEALEGHESGESEVVRVEHALLKTVPLAAAILAVLAGLSSLYAGRLAETMLSLKNEGILSEAKSSDTWAEYEADSLKAHIAETAALIAPTAQLRKKFAEDAATYRKRQGPLREEASKLTAERESAMGRAEKVETRKLLFDVAVALFQIAIVMASVSAMVRRPPLFYVALVVAVGGAIFAGIGLFA
jgi:hypothetical protein